MKGITHSAEGQPLLRQARVLKVGLGVPRGKASYIYTYRGRWIIRYGVWKKSEGSKDKLIMETAKGIDGKLGFATRAECQEWYEKNKAGFAVSNRPQKLQFFTFTHRRVVEEQGKPTEIFEPDFDAIECCGDTPTQLDVVFMSDAPFSGEYQAWSVTELKCRGDGENALRVISMGGPTWPGWQEAKEAGEKYFPVSQCWLSGQCPYMQEGGKDKLVCKPGTTLNFQLTANMRLGATAYFHTTSIRSTQQIFSALYTIRMLVERAGGTIVGLPLKLVLAPFRSNHNGIAAIQPGVGLELRASDMQGLRKAIAESAWSPRQVSATPKMIEAGSDEDDVIVTDAPMEDVSAPGIAAEFYPDFEDDGEAVTETVVEVPSASASAAEKTQEKGAALAEKLTEKMTERMAKAAVPVAAPVAVPVAVAPVAPVATPVVVPPPVAAKPVLAPASPGVPWGIPYVNLKPWQKTLASLNGAFPDLFKAVLAARGLANMSAVTEDIGETVAGEVRAAAAGAPKDLF